MNNEVTKFKWKAKFAIKANLQQSETIGDYFFKVENANSIIVEKEYETNSADERHPQQKHSFEYSEETIARLYAEEIYIIMLKRMIFQRDFNPIEVELENDYPTLVNKDELKGKGIKITKPRQWYDSKGYAISDVDGSISSSETFWNAPTAFQGTASGQEDEVIRIASWLERSTREDDNIKSFILAWIAFNTLFGLFKHCAAGTARTERDTFKFLIQSLIDNSQAGDIINSLSGQIQLLQGYGITLRGGEDVSNILTNKMQDQSVNNVERLNCIIDCVYGVRNQIFHDAPRTDDIHRKAKTSKMTLIPIFTVCLKAFVTHP